MWSTTTFVLIVLLLSQISALDEEATSIHCTRHKRPGLWKAEPFNCSPVKVSTPQGELITLKGFWIHVRNHRFRDA
ncbi:hypothetical protein EG68_04863 [Paragonimus skrjabini miyazakii]|uniref:Uncharacterized protein n=1 Tax=Paragonimus skrjabini miyazakii TaxID=59628 RepID=A0A8S9YSF6_9TREM|nr:hypothetical protein EG68_04863 [Paragonimus skrjabini miyazakii]